jgi:hypothetical protein
LNEAELILSSQKDSLLPVSKVWEEVVKRSKIHGFVVTSLPDFSALLEGDRRFKIIPAQVKGEAEEDALRETELADQEMENLGFFSEDRVRLSTSRVITTEINEDEEEIGSIRRRAFVSQARTSKMTLKKNSGSVSKVSTRKPIKKTKPSQKVKSAKQKKIFKTRKKDVRRRTKK